MRSKLRYGVVIAAFAAVASTLLMNGSTGVGPGVVAQTQPTPTPMTFDQAAAIAKLKEQIKGRENEPAPAVFKNIQTPFMKRSSSLIVSRLGCTGTKC